MRFEMYRQIPGILNATGQDVTARDWRWRLKGNNGEPIANGGEGYRNQSDCRDAIALVMSTDSTTLVEEV